MDVVSRTVFSFCESLCFFCPVIRARSRDPIKRYKNLLADIFPSSPDEQLNDSKISKLCEYASGNPLRIPKVGFFNLVKSAKDQNNHLWLAEATESSTYSLNFDYSNCSHLRNNAVATQSWAKSSKSVIDRLKEKLKIIIGDCEG